jgi:hypothetical protein
MPLEECRVATADAKALPDPVTEDEARVEDRNNGPFTRNELAVDPDQNALVARVVLEVVGPVGQLVELAGLEPATSWVRSRRSSS